MKKSVLLCFAVSSKTGGPSPAQCYARFVKITPETLEEARKAIAEKMDGDVVYTNVIRLDDEECPSPLPAPFALDVGPGEEL